MEEQTPQSGDTFSENLYNEKIRQMRDVVSSIVIGQQGIADLMLTALLADGHVLIEGVPGIAKTLSARLVAKLVDARFSRIQFTSDIMPSDVLGTNIFNMSNRQFELHKGPAFADIVLVDEINRAPAKTQSALFEVMEEKQATIDGVRYPLGETYTVIATQNPIEQEGTYRLPEAQLDRFMFKISAGYPDEAAELQVLRCHNERRDFTKLNGIEPIIGREELSELRKTASATHIDDKILHYIVAIVQLTRKHRSIYVGASPRASIAFMAASKAYALLQGRSYVIPDDVKTLAYPILQHRLTLTAEAEMDGTTVRDVISDILNKVDVPK